MLKISFILSIFISLLFGSKCCFALLDFNLINAALNRNLNTNFKSNLVTRIYVNKCPSLVGGVSVVLDVAFWVNKKRKKAKVMYYSCSSSFSNNEFIVTDCSSSEIQIYNGAIDLGSQEIIDSGHMMGRQKGFLGYLKPRASDQKSSGDGLILDLKSKFKSIIWNFANERSYVARWEKNLSMQSLDNDEWMWRAVMTTPTIRRDHFFSIKL